MNKYLKNISILVFLGGLLALSSCQSTPTSPSVSATENALAIAQATDSCQGCSQATQDAANSLTQASNDTNALNAQATATAAIVRADEMATLNAANSTHRAALAQDSVRLTQAQFNLVSTVNAETQVAIAQVQQQNNDAIAAATQTAVSDVIATQTQAGVATSQWYVDQARQRDELRQAPIAFVWMWCLPVFIVLFAILGLWGFWRWLRIQQKNQRITADPIGVPQAPVVSAAVQQDPPLQSGSDFINDRIQLTKEDDEMPGWLDETKRKLLNQEKDSDDNPNS
jgi:hypothetical protein